MKETNESHGSLLLVSASTPRDESGKYNPDEDQLGTGNSKLPFPGCEDFDARIVEVSFQT